jgi:ABC-type Na+ efflux pump permease subunit
MAQRLPVTAQAVESIGAALALARERGVGDEIIALMEQAQRASLLADFGRKIATNLLSHGEVTQQTRLRPAARVRPAERRGGRMKWDGGPDDTTLAQWLVGIGALLLAFLLLCYALNRALERIPH